MVLTIEGVTLAIILGALGGMLYCLRILVLLERRIARIDHNIAQMTRKIASEEIKIEEEEKKIEALLRKRKRN